MTGWLGGCPAPLITVMISGKGGDPSVIKPQRCTLLLLVACK
jgi:hypothetical protein